jgi:hypothetical protein
MYIQANWNNVNEGDALTVRILKDHTVRDWHCIVDDKDNRYIYLYFTEDGEILKYTKQDFESDVEIKSN